MVNNQNPYNQPSTGPMMPPQRPAQKNWQQRFLSGNTGRELTLQQERTLPNWLIGKSVAFFFVAFALCTVVWGYPMEMRDAIIASLSVLLFFYGSRLVVDGAVHEKEKIFVRNVFIIGFAARFLWVIYCYFFFNPEYWGNTYGDTADTAWYIPFGQEIAEWMRGNVHKSFGEIKSDWGSSIDDVGYPIWLAIVYVISLGESDVFVPFLVKCLVGAYCAICIYYVAQRHFCVGVARMAALFVALNPNMIYWCGNMFKEVEMVFLCCLCVDLVDRTFTSGAKLTFRGLLPGILAGFALFFFRAALGMVIFLAMFAHIVMASGKVMSIGKKVIAGVLVAMTLLVGMGDQLRKQTQFIVDTAQSDAQEKNMEWRARRVDSGGRTQSFAKYASAAVFAPLIFTIPFPTFNESDVGQILQRQLSGGSYIKNIFSFFVIYVMIIMILSGEWRRHVFIIAYTMGYLVTLVLSQFAQSGRFHMPVWPMLMLFAAYGIQIAKTNKRIRRWWPMVLVVEVLACLAWNWYKLAGRGMI